MTRGRFCDFASTPTLYLATLLNFTSILEPTEIQCPPTAQQCVATTQTPPRKKSRDREHKKQVTPEEKEAAKTKRSATEVLQEKKEEWAAGLKPWTGDERMRWPLGTLALFKADAKGAFKLTEAEMLTLPHESIPNSGKSYSYYALSDVKALARRKFLAGASLVDLSADSHVLENAGVQKKHTDNGQRNRGNWGDASTAVRNAVKRARATT
ncbi:hypothetical protein MSAN_01676400 [Mycena sanguinolenta]|uniref:Uncharacterized protein n=1 Tax=Mycena sanguinolenta TaxID=230812 RepID=A0A8H6Y3A5_9AGAR|nr:hypothetical protein MSAN_01676400 [Mycena sanguinolenta]